MDIFERIPLEILENKKHLADILSKDSLRIFSTFNGPIQLDIMLHLPMDYRRFLLSLVSAIFNLFKNDEMIAKVNIYYGGTTGCIDLGICEAGDYQPFPHKGIRIPQVPESNQATKENDIETLEITKYVGKIIGRKLPPPYELYIEFSIKKQGCTISYCPKIPDLDHYLKYEFNQYGLENIGIYALHAQKIYSNEDYIEFKINSINDKFSYLRFHKEIRNGIGINFGVSKSKARILIDKFNQNSMISFDIEHYCIDN